MLNTTSSEGVATYVPGDVLLVRYLQTDETEGHLRPVVVVSTAAHNKSCLDVIAVQVTAQTHHESLPGSVRLQDWQAAGLKFDSVVKPVVNSYSPDRIVRKLGALSARDRVQVKLSLATILGFQRAEPTLKTS